ncbi:hypothetical protein [Sphingomonas sp. CFBP9019]|uniref:hypothetical protein n=1 Tax=Sphingomonas sp. CFBP9019 TaxID=3096532 RepID=UPI002A6AE7CF|nr:hypothetical protein [Sphingomonas sp. CFBP9019]MDY1008948.1 hypothetical protein [Sphingomonas sp. CFBP9019]
MSVFEAGKMGSNAGSIADKLGVYLPKRRLTPIVIIYGPVATGKTFHAIRFASYYGCTRVMDDFVFSDALLPQSGTLVLTTEHATLKARWPLARFIHVNVARMAIGLSCAPAGGFRA